MKYYALSDFFNASNSVELMAVYSTQIFTPVMICGTSKFGWHSASRFDMLHLFPLKQNRTLLVGKFIRQLKTVGKQALKSW